MKRYAFTLLEVMVTMVILVILGGLIAGSYSSFSRDSKILAGRDTLTSQIAFCRTKAMEDNIIYIFRLSEDGKTINIHPHEYFVLNEPERHFPDFYTTLPEGVTVEVLEKEPAINGFYRVATFQIDGTCREDLITIILREPGIYPIMISIRGVTGGLAKYKGKP